MSIYNKLDRVLDERGLSEEDALDILKYLTKTSYSDLSQCSETEIRAILDYLIGKQKQNCS